MCTPSSDEPARRVEPTQRRIARGAQRQTDARLRRESQGDKPALCALPVERFQPGTWKRAKVNIDCHVELEKHSYSAPHALVGEEVEICFTATTVEVYHGNRRVASHLRSRVRGQHTTEPGHLPKSHQKHLQWTPSRLIHWGESVGFHTGQLIEAILLVRGLPRCRSLF